MRRKTWTEPLREDGGGRVRSKIPGKPRGKKVNPQRRNPQPPATRGCPADEAARGCGQAERRGKRRNAPEQLRERVSRNSSSDREGCKPEADEENAFRGEENNDCTVRI
ncbi:UNVERIFIED_CONTAM: hypothetical protein HHA_450740 [Hammondia hammondi]|eukprot:XP_008883189.1 hypothetical protein HHA_450740 [Hammondia hammondi]